LQAANLQAFFFAWTFLRIASRPPRAQATSIQMPSALRVSGAEAVSMMQMQEDLQIAFPASDFKRRL
jgi:hypothetical protein